MSIKTVFFQRGLNRITTHKNVWNSEINYIYDDNYIPFKTVFGHYVKSQ